MFETVTKWHTEVIDKQVFFPRASEDDPLIGVSIEVLDPDTEASAADLTASLVSVDADRCVVRLSGGGVNALRRVVLTGTTSGGRTIMRTLSVISEGVLTKV